MHRRQFLTTATAGATLLAFPVVLRAQSKEPIRIGFPLPLTGTFAAIAADLQKGAQLAMEELNAKGGVMGRKIEVLFRDDELKPAVGAQRTKELIENQKVDFVVGGLAAHVQMAINEQTKAAKKLYISVSQSDEISAKPDTSPLMFHEALNPTITSRTMATYGMQNIGKKWWVVYADYAWGKQNNVVFNAAIAKLGGTVLGSTPYPLGKPEFSAHLPKIQAAKPDAIYAVTPGADNVPFLKQAISFGLKKDAKIAQPLTSSTTRRRAAPKSSRTSTGLPTSATSWPTPCPRPSATSKPSRGSSRRPRTRTPATATTASWKWPAASSCPSRPTPTRWPTRSARTASTTTTRASSGGGPATTSPSKTSGSSRSAHRSR